MEEGLSLTRENLIGHKPVVHDKSSIFWSLSQYISQLCQCLGVHSDKEATQQKITKT